MGQLNPDAYRVFAPVVGVAVGLAVLFTTQMTRREVPHLYQPRQASRCLAYGRRNTRAGATRARRRLPTSSATWDADGLIVPSARHEGKT